MDWNNLRDTVSNLTLYDVKAGVRKVQNGEWAWQGRWKIGRADEAHSGDELHGDGGQGAGGDQQRAVCCDGAVRRPMVLTAGHSWGASSSLMQEIANGTFN
jgi:epsin